MEFVTELFALLSAGLTLAMLAMGFLKKSNEYVNSVLFKKSSEFTNSKLFVSEAIK